MEVVAIVLSAGVGSRMKSDIPKQYMDLNGKPVIFYSLKAFEEAEVSSIILVCGKNDVEYCKKEIVEAYGFTKVKAVVPGGANRYDSVYEGLKAIESADYVLVHDGARPMVDLDLISRVIDSSIKDKACVAAVPVKDTIKIADEEGFAKETPDRSQLWSVQTPQGFSFPLLKSAYEKLYLDLEAKKEVPTITDDAMVIEYATSQKVRFVEGSYLNIKITTPEDIKFLQIFQKK